MSDRPVPIWPLAGLDQMTFRDLPWPKKRALIIQYQGLPVFEFNGRCWPSGEPRTMECRFVPDCYPHSISTFKKRIPKGLYLDARISKN